MREKWEKDLACLVVCPRCGGNLSADSRRILSIYNHEPICMACKEKEEQRSDYEENSKKLIGQWLSDAEVHYGDLAGYFYHHFNPFKC